MIYSFAGCTMDTARMVLTRDGEQVAIEPLVFDVLRTLAENAGALVTKDLLIEAVWQGRIVSEAAISVRINAARAAVGDNGKDQAVIRTVPRRGFEMVAEVRVLDTAPPAGSPVEQTVRYATAPDGASIAWSEAGDGPPVLYASHHLSHIEKDWSSSLVGPTMRDLARDHRLIRFDMRGTGLSDPLRPGDTFENHVTDMAAVADAAGLDRFPIVACLQAAATAVRLAAAHPGRVSRMVLLNPYARGRALRPGAPSESASDPFIALLKSGGWGDPDNGFMRAWATMVLPMASSGETTDLIRLIAQASSTEDALLQRDIIDRLDVTDALGAVRCPVRAIHARLCSIHPATEGRRVAAGIPGAEFMEVDSSNTFFIASDPVIGRVTDAIRGFLAQDGA